MKGRGKKLWCLNCLLQVGNSRQYDFNSEVIQLQEELADSLDKSFVSAGLTMPPTLKTLIEKGISVIRKDAKVVKASPILRT